MRLRVGVVAGYGLGGPPGGVLPDALVPVGAGEHRVQLVGRVQPRGFGQLADRRVRIPHGPYHYWTRKARGKTVGLKLTDEELGLYREWIENNRELERLVKEMRRVSSRVLALITGRQAP